MARQLEVTYTRSSIGQSQRQRRTVEALGLRKLNDRVLHDDTPTIRGMVHAVQHLVTCVEMEEGNQQ
jgi:large subunit ribosomal protein L30